jgi:membrane complex biogenesis BtpA family protein
MITRPFLPQWALVAKPVIGMLHLAALPGSPRYGGDLDRVRGALLRDAEALAAGGVHGLMMENFGDVPFFPGRVPAHVVACMTALAAEVRRRFPDLPLGINVLRNDARSALAVAHAVGAQFVRVNVLCGGRLADQGVLEAVAHDLLRDRAALGATGVRILADVDVKHSAPLAVRPLCDEVDDTLHRGLADGLIVSGSGTGRPTDPGHLVDVKAAAGDALVFVGSGVSIQTIQHYLPYADGFIVGTSLKKDGDPANSVDVARVREIVDRASEHPIRSSGGEHVPAAGSPARI